MSYQNILHHKKSVSTPGTFKITPQGIGHKSAAGILEYPAKTIQTIQYSTGARGFDIKIITNTEVAPRFGNFKEEDVAEITTLAQRHYGIKMEQREFSMRGWNWGDVEFEGRSIMFQIHKKTAFEIPLAGLANSALTGKNEVSLEWGADEENKRGDELVEMRFFVPGAEGDEDIEDDQGAAASFHDTIKDKARLGQISGTAVISFKEITLLTPRGKYDLDMYPTMLRLHGKTYDYKVSYDNIQRAYLLPRTEETQIMFVFSLKQAIRQGQTQYPFIVCQFARDHEEVISTNLTDEKLTDEYNNKLKAEYDAPVYETVVSVFKALTDKMVIEPDKQLYSSHYQSSCVKCSLKASEAYLYPLANSFVFIPKPAISIEHREIQNITFSRVSALSTARTFDFKILLRNGVEHQFSSIIKDEYTPLLNYVENKGLKMKSELAADEEAMDMDAAPNYNEQGSSDEDSPDEDFVAGEDSDVAEEYESEYSSGGDAAGGDDD